MRYLSLASIIVALIVSSQMETAQAGHPFRGPAKWSILLCNYSDSPATPARSLTELQDMLIQPGTGGLADFYRDVARGAVTMEQSVVRGWFTIPMTADSVRAFSHGGPGGDRNRSFQLCVDAARNGDIRRQPIRVLELTCGAARRSGFSQRTHRTGCLRA